jgi:3-deoxy-D-manno-octulosonic-acid transferase
MLWFYNIVFPLGFLFFIPGMIYKLIRRPGIKNSFPERFAIFSEDKIALLASMKKPIWIHSVSVGETMIALSLISRWQKEFPERNIVLSTTTTTGQALAMSKAPENVPVFFCPIDFIPFVRKTMKLVKPSMLVIFETEIWPNLVGQARKSGAKVALVNARMSDRSVKGYRRFRNFFSPVLKQFDLISVQTEHDKERFDSIASGLSTCVGGNMKFDQHVPEQLPDLELYKYFGEGEFKIILAASTHPGEEALIASTYLNMKKSSSDIRLVIVPRHAERANEISQALDGLKLKFHRRTVETGPEEPVDCLLADTTGEMLAFINAADIVIMGKSMAGHDEGHNLIEPALLGKPIVTGSVLRNFRFVLRVLEEAEALITINSDSELEKALVNLIDHPDRREELGQKARQTIMRHEGATEKNIKMLEDLLCN